MLLWYNGSSLVCHIESQCVLALWTMSELSLVMVSQMRFTHLTLPNTRPEALFMSSDHEDGLLFV